MGLREKYETYHKCRFTLEAVNAAVYLSARYIIDRYLPDKAIDLIDEAGSKAHIQSFKMRKEQETDILSKPPDDYWQEIRTVQAMHEVVITFPTLVCSLFIFFPILFADNLYFMQVQSSRLKYVGGATKMDESSEIVVESPLPSASDHDEYDPCPYLPIKNLKFRLFCKV